MSSRFLLLVIFLVSGTACFSQYHLKGHIRSRQTELPMENVLVQNLETKKITLSNNIGHYIIPASEGDTVVFSITAYVPDTVVVTFGLLITNYDPDLEMNMISLKGVTVRNSYQLDSINRRQSYNELKGSMRGITGNNRPTDGVGVSISPLSFFSYRAKQKRVAARRIENREKEFYIDDKFPVTTVGRLTKLTGDSLNLFMYMYRPTYKQARKMDHDDLIEYVSDKLILFRNRKVTPVTPESPAASTEGK
ncbi:MAG: hypothetical protein ABWZ25_06830 [Chitinophagaceae bacterium]